MAYQKWCLVGFLLNYPMPSIEDSQEALNILFLVATWHAWLTRKAGWFTSCWILPIPVW